jgi:hypothetical protein
MSDSSLRRRGAPSAVLGESVYGQPCLRGSHGSPRVWPMRGCFTWVIGFALAVRGWWRGRPRPSGSGPPARGRASVCGTGSCLGEEQPLSDLAGGQVAGEEPEHGEFGVPAASSSCATASANAATGPLSLSSPSASRAERTVASASDSRPRCARTRASRTISQVWCRVAIWSVKKRSAAASSCPASARVPSAASGSCPAIRANQRDEGQTTQLVLDGCLGACLSNRGRLIRWPLRTRPLAGQTGAGRDGNRQLRLPGPGEGASHYSSCGSLARSDDGAVTDDVRECQLAPIKRAAARAVRPPRRAARVSSPGIVPSPRSARRTLPGRSRHRSAHRASHAPPPRLCVATQSSLLPVSSSSTMTWPSTGRTPRTNESEKRADGSKSPDPGEAPRQLHTG